MDDEIEEELHVIVQCTDVAQRVTGKLEYAVSVIKEMLTPPVRGWGKALRPCVDGRRR